MTTYSVILNLIQDLIIICYNNKKHKRKKMKQSYIYIISNKTNSVLYIGVTSDLVKRIYQHREKTIEGFSLQYNLNKLVYYEVYDEIEEAIKREKQLKNWKRQWKEELILKMNPDFEDLYNSIL